jgi:pyrimidine-nucleoside phosphorylase
MRAVDLIAKKRDGGEHTRAEIRFLVEGLTSGDIPDYQVAAWAMAVLLRGMTARETTELTLAMAESGEQLDLSRVVPLAVDKHSTGGVGDKTTLVVEPVVAACGLPVGKMSGRGLGYSGGTLDKMESIRGYRVELTTEEFQRQLGAIGLVLCGQTADLAPADGKLYALRDVTGTVPSIPLIASSVMCKKIAAGAKAIVLDVKVGRGAFLASVPEAKKLGRLMVQIASRSGRKAVALISDMNQPLGLAVGNALEVREAIDTLRGGGPPDFVAHCLHVAAHMLALAGALPTLAAARRRAEAALRDGSGLHKFRQLVEAQGGDVSQVDNPDRLPNAARAEVVNSPKAGYVHRVDAREIGLASVELGAGRSKKGEAIDPGVGLVLHHKVGDRVRKGEPLATVHASSQAALARAQARVLEAYTVASRPAKRPPLFYAAIRSR